MTNPANHPTRLLRRHEVEHMTGLSRSTIYARIKNLTFPCAIRLGARAVAWRLSDIEEFLRNPFSYVAH
ncbi:helix-turn-helix transcriptional regulator [Paraburkholderia dinghuensis]|uniref:AlpA family transcriptional regulator n=1 Tax=Paraburkholderia dinghuensis TaxID=2305225 RepID=A0A3N6PH66_9BURK|nr:AlpA family transcriptional regulator [Paraburkholderia dinghuensis]RQG99829.1 AlpA family transcriptional regulator [Paraburkholderia dinghuensis]